MFNIGDLIIYANEGVCRVEDIGCPNIEDINTERMYYTLAPLYRDGKTYIPIDTPVFMRPVITREQLEALIHAIPAIETDVCNDRNIRTLSDHYESSIKTHECADLVQIIKNVYTKRNQIVGEGKKLGQTDERYMKRAEDLLYGEFAAVLGITREDVKGYVEDRIGQIVASA